MYENITIAVASDHGVFHPKQTLMEQLAERARNSPTSARSTTKAAITRITLKPGDAVCGRENSPFGILVWAQARDVDSRNKVDGIRAALCCDTFSARMARMHNDANIICLGERVTGSGLACDIIDAFFAAEFMGGKHLRRVDKIMSLEK